MVKYNIGWGLTNKCNMNCKFCYSKETRNLTSELSISEWKKFIDSNYKYIETINYGTGENSLLNEFFEFINYVRSKYPYIKQSLTTNGYLYKKVNSDEKYYNIYLNCIDEVDVSLDFSKEEKHTDFRGQDQAYYWALKTLEMLKKDNKKATIVFIGVEETLKKENIDGLFAIALKYNALLRMNIYRPVSLSKEINREFIVSYKTILDILYYINKKYKILSINDVLFGNILGNKKITENTGIDSIRILPNGDICPSTYLITSNYRNIYNIKQANVLEKIDFKDFISPDLPNECKCCKIKNSCNGGVFDRRLLWFKSLSKRDPYCPFENNDDINKEKVKILKKDRISVHDGYIPTIFFSN